MVGHLHPLVGPRPYRPYLSYATAYVRLVQRILCRRFFQRILGAVLRRLSRGKYNFVSAHTSSCVANFAAGFAQGPHAFAIQQPTHYVMRLLLCPAFSSICLPKSCLRVKKLDMAAFSLSLLFLLSLASTVRSYLQIYPSINENDTRTPLYFALLQSFGGQYNGSGSVAGLQVALDRINKDPNLLPGYTLHYTLTDTQVRHN